MLWITAYAVDNAIHPLNNWGLEVKLRENYVMTIFPAAILDPPSSIYLFLHKFKAQLHSLLFKDRRNWLKRNKNQYQSLNYKKM